MRKLPLVIGLLACIPLAGCNWWPGHKPAPQRVVVTCHCTPPIRGARDVGPAYTTPTHERTSYRSTRRHHHYRHTAHYSRHRYTGSRRYIWHKRRAEASVDIYGYSSSSRAYRNDTYGRAHGGMHGHAYGHSRREGWQSYGDRGTAQHSELEGRYRRGGMRVWADGYGRRHLYDQSAVRYYSYQAHMRQKETPERLDPWHFYNDDWD